MFYFLRNPNKEMPRGTEFAHLHIDEEGEIVFANRAFVELAQSITQKRMTLSGTIGKKISELFAKETGKTVVGTYIKKKTLAPVNS